jgi:hypothetical protein
MEDATGPSAISLLSLLILAASAPLPKFVVPNFPDLKIKTRRTVDDRIQTEETTYLKGPRQRSEHILFGPKSSVESSSISQCDQRLMLIMNDKDKLYATSPIQDSMERTKDARPRPQPQMSGADVNVTVDSVDTGERRKIGSYEARHVRATTKVEPGPGAVLEASVSEVDGWYVDLPGFGCHESRGVAVLLAGVTAAGEPHKHDRVVVKHLGNNPSRGFPIEETSRDTQRNLTTVSKLELLEFSEKPLDDSLFELPSGYRPALRTPNGGLDMTKPDTLTNRLQAYWDLWTASARRWFR